MSAAVGAALKKVLVAILTEPKVLKNILFAILVVVVAMILPTVFVVSIFSGDFEVDTASLQQYVEDNLSAADIVLLTNVENTMEAIEDAMIEAELGSEARTAQVLYVLALSDYASQPGFVSRLVSCFRLEQTDSQLINAVNAQFGTNIQLQDFSNVMRNIRSRQINTSTYTDPGTKNNLDLVEWAIAAYNADWGYVMGTYGLVLTEDLLEAKLIQLPDAIEPYEEFIRANYLGLRTADCIGLIKGYSWYDVDTGEIGYATNGHPDVGADQLYNNATEKGPISTLPEIPGLILHAEGHVGIYIGGGYAIEAMDKHREDPKDIGAKAKAEKYAKILAKTIINPEGEGTDRGQNAYFYDSAEGLLASVVLLLAEFLPPEETGGYEMRHIASVFKLVQELLMQSSSRRGGNQFQELMSLLPADHKAKWLAGSALTASDQGMNSIMSTVLSKLNAFLDTELEQVICFDGSIDAELFVKEKCAIFLILPEEDATKNFVASLMIQNLARELFSVANEHGGKLPNRAVFFCDELGTMPPFDILPLFSAGRSRRLTLVPIIQSLAQLEKNYGKEGSEIMCDNCQDTIFGGFAPNSQTANTLSGNLGSRTVLSGTVTKGKNDDSQSLQMMERPLMSPDELKSMPKGSFVVMKTGTHPMKTKLKLFFEWGIQFQKPLEMPDRGSRPVYYAGKQDLERSILSQFPMIHMTMGATMPPGVQTAPKPMSTTININTEDE